MVDNYDNYSWDDDDADYSTANGVTSSTGGSGGACGAASSVSSAITSESTTLTTGTYMVYPNVTVPSRIQINGNVTINLGAGATLHAPKGFEVSQGNSLTINGPGALTIDNCDSGKSGIGADNVGTIVINGGTINVTGGGSAAGIGGDRENTAGGTITINGGVVNAWGGSYAAGIGGGKGRMQLSGDSNLGRCGIININGGQVSAYGDDSAGIGPGFAYEGQYSGELNLQWTNSDDFVYCNNYTTGYPTISLRIINLKKTFVLDGTATIATTSNIGGQRIVPYVEGQTALTGAGTEGEPWRISTAADRNALVQNVLNGNDYSGEYVKLMADIDIARGVGVKDSRSFSGTFLGGGHTLTANLFGNTEGTAPFISISGATIKDLTVAGTITSNQSHVSGVVGFASGTNLIEGCTVRATLDLHNHYAGGIVGHGLNSNTTIRDCIFAGHFVGNEFRIYAANGSYTLHYPNHVGGLWGWNDDGATPVLVNCLEKGTYTSIESMHPIGLQGDHGTIADCYYMTPQIGSPYNVCTVGGAYRAYTSNTVEGEMLRPLQLADGNTYYTPCLIAIDAYYHRTGSAVSVAPVVTASDGTPLTLGTDFTATLNGEAVEAFPMSTSTLGNNTFTITGLGNCYGSKSVNVIVYGFNGAGTAEDPYTISNTGDWDAFVSEVSFGNACSGKYVQLTADIAITQKCGTVAGSTQVHAFSGTFDGGHTITATIEDNSNQGTAPFCYIDGATIRNLTTAGTISTNQQHSSGLVGFASGTNLIEGCTVRATISFNCNYAGGIVGHGLSSATTIRNCVFAGRFEGILWEYRLGYYTAPWYIGYLWGWSDSGATPTLENCIEIGTWNNVYNRHPMGLLGENGTGTVTNCYYLENPTTDNEVNWTVTPGSEYCKINTDPSDTEIRRKITILDTTVYSENCTVSGVDASYFANGAITPVVAEPDNSTALTFGTDYTVTLDGEPVEEFPVSISTTGSHTLVFTGTGNYVGSKTVETYVYTTLAGTGSEADPYIIGSTDNWNSFASYVNGGGNNYSGKFLKLTDDITVTDMVGTSETVSFQGTFLGNNKTLTFTKGSADAAYGEDYCAPFCYVKNATIRDLKVTGDIYTSQMYAAGLVSQPYGTTTITDCAVSTNIYSSASDEGFHGGFVAIAYNAGTLNIEGSAYNGRLLTNNGTNLCGGFAGRCHVSVTVNVSNSLYAPAATFLRAGRPSTTAPLSCATAPQASPTATTPRRWAPPRARWQPPTPPPPPPSARSRRTTAW